MRLVACAALAIASVPSAHAWGGWSWPWGSSNPTSGGNSWPWGSPSPGSGSGSDPGNGSGSGSVTTTYSTTTQVSCKTIQGPIQPVLGVVTQTLTQQISALFPTTVQSTTTPTVKVTPNPVQVTVPVLNLITVTVKAPDVTSIFSTTSTIIQSIVATVSPPLATTSVTVGRTSTTFTSTSTIPASGGFLGVLATGLPVLTRVKREELLDLGIAREELDERGLFDWWKGGGQGSGGNPGDIFRNGLPGLPNLHNLRSLRHTTLFDQKVLCFAKVITSKIIITVVTAPAKTTTLCAETVTTTKTTTSTSTSTIPPNSVTVTSSFSETTTTSTTVTLRQQTVAVTTTTSAILSLPTTFYSACDSNNLLGPTLPSLFGAVAGDLITDIYYDDSKVQLMTSPGDRAYDCCVQCLQQTGCSFGSWMPSGICYLHVTLDQTCPAQSSIIGEYTVGPPPQTDTWAVYNGYCGSVQYGGLDSP